MRKITLMFFMFMLSLCGYSQGLPLEDFEGTWTTLTTPPAGPGGPAGWAIVNRAGSNVIWQQGTGGITQPAYQGTHAAYMNLENLAAPTDDWLITPAFEVPANPQLSFYSRLTIPQDQGTVYKIFITTDTGTLADQINTDNYDEIQSWTELTLNPSQQVYTLKTVEIPDSYIGQDVHIAFVMIGDNADRWLIDNVSVTEQCLDPTTLAANTIGTNTANLTWGNPSGATEWEIEVLPQTATQTGTGVTYDGALPFIAGAPGSGVTLTPNTDYKYYVRALCDDGGVSNWVGPFNFSTVAIGESCAAPIVIGGLPYSVTDNTANYGDTVDGTPGATGCGTNSGYLNGNDVFYSYQAPANGVINISVTNNGTWAGVFVYTSCANVGVSCVGGSSNAGAVPLSIPSLSVTAGQTYYVVISTFAAPQTTPYTLTIQQVNCAPPAGLSASNLTATSAALSWTNPSSATSWELVVQTPGAGIPAGAGTTVSSNTNVPVTQTTAGVAFTEATTYEYWVRADCGNGTFSAWTGPFTFMTTQVPATLDYTQNFEGVHGFSLSNGTQTNKWAVGSATSNSPTQSLYISNNNGAANAYTITTTSVVHAFRDLTIPAGADQVSVSFDWKNAGENNFDYIRVWMVPTSFNPAPGTQITAAADRQQLGANFVGSSTWVTNTNVLDVSAYDGTTRRLVFEWRNDGSGGTQPPGAVDNVNVSVVTCSQPSNLAIATLTDSAATYTWTGPSTGTPTYDYYIATTSTAPTASTVPTGNVTTPTFTQTPLEPSTTYYFWVRSNCGNDDESFWTGPVSFNTPQVPATMDYTQNFDGAANGFTLSNGTQTNKWAVGTATSNSPTQSLYVSNDNGVSNAYTIPASSVVHAYRDIAVTAGAEEANFSFDWKNVGETGWDYIRVWMVPITFTPTPGTQITASADRQQIGANFVGNAAWTTYNGIVDVSPYDGTTRRLVFEWRNDGSGGTQPPGAVDNVNFSVITCPQPTALAANGITTNSALLAWEPGDEEDEWEIVVQLASSDAPAETGTFTTTDNNTAYPSETLTPNTPYEFYVRAVCSEDDKSLWSGPFAFNTACEAFPVPFYEGFNSDSETEACWRVLNLNNDTDFWNMNYATAPFEGNQAANMYTDFNNGNNNDWLISPAIILTGNERLKFHYRVQSAGEPNDFRVMLSTTGFAPADFTETIIPLTSYSNTTYVESITNIDDYTGPVYIAFHVPNGGLDGWRIYVDNFIVEPIPTCPDPTDIVVSDILTTTANITWEPGFEETQWQVVVQPQGTGVPDEDGDYEITDENNPYPATGLEASTQYEVYVRAYCADDDQSNWVGPVNFETDPLCPEPVDIQVTCLSSTGAAFAWTAGADETSWEVALLPATAPVPTTGTVVTDPSYVEDDLIVSTPYTFYVRAVCSDIVGYSSWAEVDFTTPVVGPGDSEPFCAGDSGVPVPNSTNVPGYGQIGCLFSTPNPVWYYITIDNPGTLTFQLSQVNTAGNGIDVDFAAFGPFTSQTDACSQIELAPGANPLIVACSYSAAAIENFSITGAQPGQVYAILITNFNGSAGQITLTQTNANAPGAGTTSCDIAVDLGVNQTSCGTDVATITAEVNNPGEAQVYTYEWFIDGEPFDPTIISTDEGSQTIEVDELGTHIYSVVVTVPIPLNDNPITDQVTISLSPIFVAPTPAPITLCGENGTTTIDLEAIDFLGTLDDTMYAVTGIYTSQADANVGSNPIDTTVPFTVTTQTLYINIGDINVPGCFQTVQLQITVVEESDATIAYAGTPYCTNDGPATVTLTGSTGGVYSAVPVAPSTGELAIDAATGTITIANSDAGTYEVTYTVAATGTCPEFETTTQVVIVEAPAATISYEDGPYCSNAGTATVTVTGTTGGTFTTSDTDLALNATTGVIDLAASEPGTYTVTYTLAAAGTCDGSIATTEITIAPAIDATITYGTAPFCSNEAPVTVNQTGTPGGVYTAAPVAPSTGQLVIDPAIGTITIADSDAGTYEVTYTVAATASCPEFETTAQVVIVEAPEALVTYDGSPYCSNAGTATPSVTGTLGGVFTANNGLVIDPATGAIDLAANTEGTYEVTYTIAASAPCAAFTVTTQIVITPLPVATISYGTSPYCSNVGTISVVQTGTPNGVYAAPQGIVIDPATGDINLTASTVTSGSYEVTYTIPAAGGCDDVVATATIVITTLPIADFSYQFTTICQNAGPAQPIFAAGGVAGTFVVNTTGLAINPATGVIDPAASQEGTYFVTNEVAAANGCPAVVSNTITVVINPAPIPTFTYASVAYCQDEATNPSPILTDPTGAGTFTASPEGLVINSATGVIDLAASTPGTYTVTNTIAGTVECPSVSAPATVTVTALPVVTVLQGCIDNEYVLTVSFDDDDVNNPDNVTFSWTNSTGAEIGTGETLTVVNPDMYFVTVTPVGGECPVVAEADVESTSCLIPKGISPNNDGLNDSFDLSALDVRKLGIFNRYGKEVFTRTQYTNEWFGQTDSGDELPTGTYFYMIERNNGETTTGWVYINREEN